MTILSGVTCCVTAWSCYSNPNPSSKNRIIENKKKVKMREENRKKTKFTSFVLDSSLLLYPLSFAAFLNSNKISSIVLFSYFTFFNSTTFIVSSSPSPNFFFKSARNSPIIAYFNVSAFRSSKTFFFQISADPPCIYDNTYWIYFSTVIFLILILI